MKKISYKLYNKSTDDLIMEVDSLNALGILRNYGDDIVTQLKKSGTKLVISKISEEDGTQVASIAVMTNGEILMGKRNDNGKWTLPGGHSKQGENPIENAIRELKEETGITVNEEDLTYLGQDTVNAENTQLIINCFLFNQKEKTNSSYDPDDEVEKWEYIDVSDGLPEDILNNLHSNPNITLTLLGLQQPTKKESKKVKWDMHPLYDYLNSGLENKKVGDRIETSEGNGKITELRYSYESPDMLQGFMIQFDDTRKGKQFVSLKDCLVDEMENETGKKGINRADYYTEEELREVSRKHKEDMKKKSGISDMFRGDITQDTIIKFKNIFLRLPINKQKEAIKNLEALLNSGQMRQPHIGKEMLDIANMIYNINNNKNRHMSKLDRIKQIRAEVEAVVDNIAGCSTDINKESGDITTHNQPTPNQTMGKKKSGFYFPNHVWSKIESYDQLRYLISKSKSWYTLKNESIYQKYAPFWFLYLNDTDDMYLYSKKNQYPIDIKTDSEAPQILEQYPLPKEATAKKKTANKNINRIKQIKAEVIKLAEFGNDGEYAEFESKWDTGGWHIVHGFSDMKQKCKGTRWDLRNENVYNMYAPIYVLNTMDNKYAYSARNGVPIDKDDNQAPEILEQYPLPKKMASKKTAEWDTGSTIKNDILMVFTTKDWVVYIPENKNGFKLLSAGTNWNMKNSNDIYVIVNKSNRNQKFMVSNGIISDIKGNKVSSNSFKSNEGLYNFIKSNIRMASKKKSAGNTSPETQYESAYQNNKQYANTYSIPKSAEFGNDIGMEAPMNENEPEPAIFQIGETVNHNGRPANIFDYDSDDATYTITYEDNFEQGTVTEQELMSENQGK